MPRNSRCTGGCGNGQRPAKPACLPGGPSTSSAATPCATQTPPATNNDATTSMLAALGRAVKNELAQQTQKMGALMTVQEQSVETLKVVASAPGATNMRAGGKPADWPRVAVVGAGLAGLTATYRLKQGGFDVALYEGSDRIGGRVWSDSFPGGQIYERGGELVDQNQRAISQLMQELRIKRINLLQAESKGTEPVYNVLDFSQSPPVPIKYTFKEATDDLKSVWQILKGDLQAASYPTTFEISTQRGRDIDAMSLTEYIDNVLTAPLGGAQSKLAQLLKVAYNIEFGAEPDEQSPLNMIYLLAFAGPGQFRVFGPSNEKYHIENGSQHLAFRLTQELNSGVNPIVARMRHRLDEIERLQNGMYRLKFIDTTDAQNPQTVVADYERVILTLPFSVMRPTPGFSWHVKWDKAQFSAKKAQSINNIGMSRNGKLNILFRDRYWREEPYENNGDSYCRHRGASNSGPEQCFQCTWEVSRGQEDVADSGILVNYTGGDYADNFVDSRDPSVPVATIEAAVNKFFDQVKSTTLPESVPGGSAPTDHFQFEYDQNGRLVNVDSYNWSRNEFARGAYSFWKPRQYSLGDVSDDAVDNDGFAGVEPMPEPRSEPNPLLRNCHFAGEHTSYCFQGYMNGAVESGERTAAEVINAFKKLGVTPDF